jgi:hypothetical protein
VVGSQGLEGSQRAIFIVGFRREFDDYVGLGRYIFREFGEGYL